MTGIAEIRMPPGKKARGTWRHIFAIPIIMGLLSGIGLVTALVGDDIWDWLSWATLGIPILVIAYFIIRPARAS
jgi:hypothetical protein